VGWLGVGGGPLLPPGGGCDAVGPMLPPPLPQAASVASSGTARRTR
jgi:hypothetical protein